MEPKIKLQLLKHTTECLQYGGDLKLGLNHCEGVAQFRNGASEYIIVSSSTFVTNLNYRDYQEGGETKSETIYTYSESIFFLCFSLIMNL